MASLCASSGRACGWLQQQQQRPCQLPRPLPVMQQHHQYQHQQQLLLHTAAAASRHVPRALFDSLRGMLPGGGQPQQQQQQEVEVEADEEGGTMVRIDQHLDSDVFGPCAVLLVGFQRQEVDAVRSLLAEMGADGMVTVLPCTRAMLGGSLLQALEAEAPVEYEQPPLGQRRAVFFSGLLGSEVVEIIAAFRDQGLPPCVFAGLVPNNADRQLDALLDAVWRDHAAMAAKARQRLSGGDE